jgi:hypothetical protein
VALDKLAVLAFAALTALPILSITASVGCYRGFDVEDKQPPPGHPGGQCLLGGCFLPTACMEDEQVCYDPNEPCKGIYCSGNGTCAIDMSTNLPVCTCDLGFTNQTYAYFCMPIGL